MTDDKATPAAELPRGVRKVTRGWEVDLDYPIERGGEETSMLAMRRSNVGDSLAMTKYADDDGNMDTASAVEAGIELASRLLGLTSDETQTIDQDDWPRVQEVISAHMEKRDRGKQT